MATDTTIGSRSSRPRLNRLVLASGLVSILAVVGVAPTAAISATPLGTNLIKNGGFEAGVGGDGNQLVSIPNWLHEDFDHSTVVRYGSPGGFPTRAESTRIGGGNNFLSCGPNTSGSEVFQGRRIIGRNLLIDQERLWLTAKVRIATYDGQADYGYIQIAGTDTVDGLNDWAWVSPHITATNGKFKLVTVSNVVPAGTRYLRVWLIGRRPDGSGPYCDAYFDKVSLVLKKIT